MSAPLNMSASGYRPSAWQLKFHKTNTDWALGAGSAGPGKSLCLLWEPFFQQIPIEHARCMRDPRGVATEGGELWKEILEHPLEWGGSSGYALFLMRDLKRLRETMTRARRAFSKVDPGVVYRAEDSVYTFSSGYQYQFGHCLEITDYEKYDSNQYTMLLVDELAQFDDEQIDNIEVRVRSSDPILVKYKKKRAMSNPQRRSDSSARVRDPYWVRKRFVDPCREGNKILRKSFKRKDGTTGYKTRIYLPATLYDNPDKEFVRQYEDDLRANNKKHIVEAMLYGNWYVVPGAFYADAWLVDKHVCKPFKLPAEWRYFRSMDWGYKTNGCVHWWAISPDDVLHCIREYTFIRKTADVVAEEIADIEERLGLWDRQAQRSKISGPADTNIWAETGTTGKSIAATMNEAGVGWSKADKKSRRVNAQRLYERLAEEDADGMGTPGVVFFNICRRLVASLPSIPTDKDDPECPADGKDDHWADSAMYAAAYASHGPQRIPAVSRTDPEDKWIEKFVKKQTPNAGRWGYGA